MMENILDSIIGDKTDGQKSTQVPSKPCNFGNVEKEDLCGTNVMKIKVPKRNQDHRHVNSMIHSHTIYSTAGAHGTLV